MAEATVASTRRGVAADADVLLAGPCLGLLGPLRNEVRQASSAEGQTTPAGHKAVPTLAGVNGVGRMTPGSPVKMFISTTRPDPRVPKGAFIGSATMKLRSRHTGAPGSSTSCAWTRPDKKPANGCIGSLNLHEELPRDVTHLTGHQLGSHRPAFASGGGPDAR